MDTWQIVARGGFRAFIEQYGLDDWNVVSRPTERKAFQRLENQAKSSINHVLPLSPLELEVWQWEKTFFAIYATQDFVSKNGRLSHADRYAWIAGRMRNQVFALQVKAILEDVEYVVKQCEYDEMIDRLVAELKAA